MSSRNGRRREGASHLVQVQLRHAAARLAECRRQRRQALLPGSTHTCRLTQSVTFTAGSSAAACKLWQTAAAGIALGCGRAARSQACFFKNATRAAVPPASVQPSAVLANAVFYKRHPAKRAVVGAHRHGSHVHGVLPLCAVQAERLPLAQLDSRGGHCRACAADARALRSGGSQLHERRHGAARHSPPESPRANYCHTFERTFKFQVFPAAAAWSLPRLRARLRGATSNYEHDATSSSRRRRRTRGMCPASAGVPFRAFHDTRLQISR